MQVKPTIYFDHKITHSPVYGQIVLDIVDRALRTGSWDESTRFIEAMRDMGQVANSGLLYCTLQYLQHGRQTFALAPVMAEELERTKLKDIKGSDILVPYETFYVALPRSLGWRIDDAEGELFAVDGLYVYRPRDFAHQFKGKPNVGLALCLWGSSKPGRHVDDDAICWLSCQFEDDEDVLGSFKPQIDKALVREKETAKTLEKALRLVINLCLYLSSKDPDVRLDRDARRLEKKAKRAKTEKKRRKAQRELMTRSVITHVGRSLEQFAKQMREEGGGVAKHRVRAHWHSYWVGPKDGQERVRKWVLPYWKGSDLAGKVHRKYYEVE